LEKQAVFQRKKYQVIFKIFIVNMSKFRKNVDCQRIGGDEKRTIANKKINDYSKDPNFHDKVVKH